MAIVDQLLISAFTKFGTGYHDLMYAHLSFQARKLTIEGHELYCPDNPDDPTCTEFLQNATNKKPAEICNSPSGCFKDQDAEKYCLNYNDPA